MGKLTVKQVNSLINGSPGRYADGDGLYFVVPKSGKQYWMLRYSANGKRREMTLGNVQMLSLAEARILASENKRVQFNGLDPLFARQRETQHNLKTVDDLFEDWHLGLQKRLKHPNIPARIYRKEISPSIGKAKPSDINARDIRSILQKIASTNRPAIANDTLMYCKQLFNHGIKLDVVQLNPASAFTATDAGGVEKSKDRFLTKEEIKIFFSVCRENTHSFARENYLACSLLLCLGVRKAELTEAKWSEFDLNTALWSLPAERSKSGVAITIPLASPVIKWLEELKVRSCGSEYVFPSRRSSKKPHMGADTLNRAITKLFGHEAGKKTQPPNLMGDMPHFTVHDLRRTCRSLLASQGVHGYIAERCLNHKIKGVEGIYNRHDYLEERKEALNLIAHSLAPIVNTQGGN
jgi:integrase